MEKEIPQQPIPAPSPTPVPTATPQASKTESAQANTKTKPPKKKTKMILLISIGILLALLIGVGGYVLGTSTSKKDPQPTPTKAPTTPTQTPTATVIPSLTGVPTDTGIPITEKTVSFTRANGTVYMRYRGHVYSEEAASKNDFSLTNLPDPTQYTWYGLVNSPTIPTDLAVFDELFDFKVLPNKSNFIFIMRWPVTDTKTEYKLYLYNAMAQGNKVFTIYTSTQGQSGNVYTVPRIKQVSSDGTYVALNMFGCWNCGGHAPETMLLNINTSATKTIGKVAYFNWKENGNYEYKEYKSIPCAIEGPGECSEDPATLPMMTGSF